MKRRFQYRLRTLFVIVTLAAILCSWFGAQAKAVRERREMLAHIENDLKGQTVWILGDRPIPTVPLVRRMLGDEAIEVIDLPTSTSAQECRRIQSVFPEAFLRDVDAPS